MHGRIALMLMLVGVLALAFCGWLLLGVGVSGPIVYGIALLEIAGAAATLCGFVELVR